MSRSQIQTAAEIAAAAETEEDARPASDSQDTSSDVSDAAPAPDTSLPSGAGNGDGSERPARRAAAPLIALILGVVLAVVGSWLWWQASNDDQLAAAETRDSVLIAATGAIETINSLDYRDVDAALTEWEDVTTGVQHDQIAATDDMQRQMLADQKKIATGEVVDAAVLRLDGDEATVVAAVEITVVDDAAPGSEPTLKRNRFSAEMKKVDGTWLIEDIKQVAVSLS
ncbi:hypothetical protein [Aeromicrobium alkaliterrae]|uniref:Mce-associated membrane protein n=1 Tax=Aeromicrobium alkaliterrae TaxID=302168 RepID=A0ABP4W0N3_9ACTN